MRITKAGSGTKNEIDDSRGLLLQLNLARAVTPTGLAPMDLADRLSVVAGWLDETDTRKSASAPWLFGLRTVWWFVGWEGNSKLSDAIPTSPHPKRCQNGSSLALHFPHTFSAIQAHLASDESTSMTDDDGVRLTQ